MKTQFSFRPLSFWLATVSVFSGSLIANLLLEVNLWFSFAITGTFVSIMLLHKPLALLGILFFTRMILDHISEQTVFFLSDTLSFSLSQLLGGFFLFISLFIFVLYAKKLPRFTPWRAFFILIGSAILLTPQSIAPIKSLQEIARMISIFSMGFLAYISVRSLKDFKKVLLILLLSGIIPIIEAFRQFFLGIGMSDNVVSAPRIYGTFVHPNVLALYLYSLAVVLVMNFFPTSEEEKKRTFHTFPVSTLLSFSLIIIPIISLTILTYTRVAWIALFLFALFVALWKFRFLLFPLLVTPLILILFVPSIQARFSETFERSVDSSIVWRQGIWHDVTTKLRMDQKEYFGTGPATFTLYAEKLRGTRFGSTDAHNDFVKFYVEGGWFGFSAFLLFLFLLTIDIRSLFLLPAPLRDFAVLFSLYAGILLLSSLSDNVHRYTPLQWIFFVLLGALLALRTHETTQVRIQENGKKE